MSFDEPQDPLDSCLVQSAKMRDEIKTLKARIAELEAARREPKAETETTCPKCSGRGWMIIDCRPAANERPMTCGFCMGSGKIIEDALKAATPKEPRT